MKIAVAEKMPACGPLSSVSDKNGLSNGANSAGRMLTTKNSKSGPRSSASLVTGLSLGLGDMLAVMHSPAETFNHRRWAELEGCGEFSTRAGIPVRLIRHCERKRSNPALLNFGLLRRPW